MRLFSLGPLRRWLGYFLVCVFALVGILTSALYWYVQSDIPDLTAMMSAVKERATERGAYTKFEQLPAPLICAFLSDTNGHAEYPLSRELVSSMMPPLRQADWHLKTAIVSWRISGSLTEREIVELVLNSLYFGRGSFGPSAGARVQFGVDVSQLSLAQMAYLIGLSRAPTSYEAHPERGRARRDQILDRMQAKGCASQAEILRAKEEPLGVIPASSTETK